MVDCCTSASIIFEQKPVSITLVKITMARSVSGSTQNWDLNPYVPPSCPKIPELFGYCQNPCDKPAFAPNEQYVSENIRFFVCAS